MNTSILLPDVDNFILCLLPLTDFMKMRLINKHFNHIICNIKLNCMHIIKLPPVHTEYIKHLGHIANLYYDYSVIHICHNTIIHPNAAIIQIDISDDIINDKLNKLTNITSLRLCSAIITDEGLRSLANITRLTLVNSPITFEGIKHLKKLVWLRLFGTSMITNEEIQLLAPMVDVQKY